VVQNWSFIENATSGPLTIIDFEPNKHFQMLMPAEANNHQNSLKGS